MGVFVSASRGDFPRFTNKCTRGSLQLFLSSDLIGSADEMKSHLAR